MKKLIRITIGLIVAQLASFAFASPGDWWDDGQDSKLQLQMSTLTYHYTYDEAHRNVLMAGLERERAQGQIDGITVFSNSFGQTCLYLYPWGGITHKVAGVNALSFKWTAGMLYGYVDPYEDKVPLNYKGFSPAAIVALAYQFTPNWSGQVTVLGNAALMFQINKSIP
jgi:hypothetical protein